jgi:predicted RND superfamily exporter protein
LTLLLYAFRKLKDIVLIALSIFWGWLFALGGMALVHDSVSMIVIGISSIIIGIAVNYPLHLISHTKHQPNIRQALSEITTPLLVGNITTVGAFLALVPLKSIALRDLGLFASFLLIGTILFVLVFLPHFIQSKRQEISSKEPHDFLSSLASLQIERKKWLVVLVAILTLVFGYFSLSIEFDSDMSNINYMTEEQKADMRYFESIFSRNGTEDTISLYMLSSAEDFDKALTCSESRLNTIDSLKEAGLIVNHKGISRFLPSMNEQTKRINRWNEWIERHPQLQSDLNAKAAKHGFAGDAFTDFFNIIESKHSAQSFDYFAPLTSQVLANRISYDSKTGRSTIVDVLSVKKQDAEKVKEVLPEAFDIASLNSSVANSLSDDFNYVGWACSLIVFLFLWLSFRRIELAIISFIPMAVSWIWILGIMSILGIKFNIVNIILATFIFGQGDDYTIFMTEGCISEYVHGKPVLTSYKRSIILSALIMFIGIGTLIFAKHPALHSLAEVTIVGMFSVVLMAYLIPPLLFKWMIKHFPIRFNT